jgi:hypothetical protein
MGKLNAGQGNGRSPPHQTGDASTSLNAPAATNTRVIAMSLDVNKMPVLLLSALTRLAEVHLKVW